MLTRLLAALRGLFYGSFFVLLWWWVVSAARSLDARLSFELPAWGGTAGPILAILGGALVLGCVFAFALFGRGTPAPFDAPREFVAAGPYRYVRNPMYLGAAGVIAGAGLWLRSPATLLVAGGFLLLAHVFVRVYEEPTLEERFGESYRQYKSVVNRWLPGRPDRNGAAADRGQAPL